MQQRNLSKTMQPVNLQGTIQRVTQIVRMRIVGPCTTTQQHGGVAYWGDLLDLICRKVWLTKLLLLLKWPSLSFN